MTKFNTRQTIEDSLESRSDAVRNQEGGLSFTMDPRTKLYTMVVTSMVGENTFYESANDKDSELKRTIQEVIKIDPMYVLKLAYYARTNMYMRSVTTLLLSEFANSDTVVPNSRKYVTACIQRADDMTELISLSLSSRNGKNGKLPMLIKNGVRNAFGKFDAYQLAKYNRDGNVKLRDVMFLTRPKPKDENQRNVWSQLIDGTLASPETWEVMRSTGKMTWSEVLNNVFHKNGKTNNYMAIIRNLQNLMKSDLSADDFDLLCNMIQDQDAIKHSKLLPFRYLSAYLQLTKQDMCGKNTTNNWNSREKLYASMENAVLSSIANIEKLPGRTVIAIDVSGSMNTVISEKSNVTACQIAAMIGMMSDRICEKSKVVLFATDRKWVNMPTNNILQNAAASSHPAGSTNGHLVINDLISQKIESDRLICLSDMILWDSYGYDSFASLWTKYKRTPFGKNCKLYNVDLTGYGFTTVPQYMPDTMIVAGWSDRIFEMINRLEGGTSVVEEIQRISL